VNCSLSRFLCFLILLVSCSIQSVKGQSAFRDSIRQVLKCETVPSKKYKQLLSLSASYSTSSLFDSARLMADEGIRIAAAAGDKQNLASFYYNKGMAYLFEGVNALALDNFLKDLKIIERSKDSSEISACYNTIGIVYLRMKARDKAVLYWEKSIDSAPRKNRDELLIYYYGNTASVFEEEKKFDSALINLNKALKLAEIHHLKKQTAISLQNIGDILIQQKKYEEALEYTLRSIALTKTSAQNYGTAQLYLNLGLIYLGIHRLPESHENLIKALAIETQGASLDEYMQIYDALARLAEAEHDFPDAYKNHLLYTKFKDSIYSQENLNSLSDLKSAYEVDKKEEDMKIKEHEEDIKQKAEGHRQRLIDTGLLVAFLLIGIVAFFLYKSYRSKNNANKVITLLKNEIEHKNESLHQINKEISDSIHYAQRIQQAILPQMEAIRKTWPSLFVFFQPKNIVSGDFYFFNKSGEEEMIIAACDCTGHGVPGAFMSMIGSEQLGKIISEWKVSSPSEILTELHKGIRHRLRQDENDSRDGMDLALCKINRVTGDAEFAGANRPLWIIRKGAGEITEIKPDKRPVGGLEHGSEQPFTNQYVNLQKGDTLYMFSDGYPDQFGGDQSKKMMLRNFKKLLLSITHLPIREQEEQLCRRFNEWKGSLEQIDDVLVIGIHI
jgi:serine phosphatase RsbU (regulator of sigma subunit)/Tfp pilus assembly protein PilF